MENYYQKYKLSSLHFGAYYSGGQYFFPSNTLSELEFNRYNNPYYIDFINLPKTGIISLFNYLEPIYSKTNDFGADKIYSLPTRTDTINVNLEKIRRVYAEKNSLKDLNTSINYFGNNLSFILSGANLYNFEWSNEDDLTLLINQLNFSYVGNIDAQYAFDTYGGFSGRGYLLQNCSGCIDTVKLIKVSGSNASLNCQDCLLNQQYDVIQFSINLGYNTYNILSQTNNNTTINSEKIKLSDLSTKNFITFTANDQDLQDAFSLTTSTEDKEFYRDKNYLPLFFRTLNLNSKKLVPFVEDQYDDNYILNESGYKITNYKYVPNIDSQKVFGSRIIDGNSILYPRSIYLASYSKDIYAALFSGIEVYQYASSDTEYIPQAEQIQETYFKYADVCGNYYLIPRRPAQIRLSGITGEEIYLNQNLSSGSRLGYSVSINGIGNTIIATAPNATVNNLQSAGTILVITGNNNNWLRTAKLTGWDSVANDQFGFSSCINQAGNIFAIGAPNASINNISGAGAVYIFTGKNQNWSGISKITGSSSYSGYQFGSSLSMNSAGNVLIAGAPTANNLSGLAYIFTGDGSNWKEYNKISQEIFGSPAREGSGYFGYSVHMNNSGNLVVVGAPNLGSGSGIVYMYTGDSYNNKNWKYKYSVVDVDTNSKYFGYSVHMNDSGNIIAVGAPGKNIFSGMCAIVSSTNNNTTWNNIVKLSGNINSGFFGTSVALNSTGNVLLVGSPNAEIISNQYPVNTKNAGLCSAYTNTTGWQLYTASSNFIDYEFFGTSVAINDTGNVSVVGAVGASSQDGYPNVGNFYINPREQTCPDVKLLDENPIEEYTIPNIKVQLDAMDNYSLYQGPAIRYCKNKVNFGKGYNNLYNSGDAITINSNIQLIDIDSNQFSGLLNYNNPKSGDYISVGNVKFIHSINFSGITGLSDLINNISGNGYTINSQIINDTTLLLSTSGSNYNKRQGAAAPINTNYLSGNNQGVVLASYYSINPLQSLNFISIANDIKNIYACRHSETGEINSSYRKDFNNIDFNVENEYFLAILKNGKITGFGTNYSGRLLGNTQSTGWDDSPVGKITGAVKLSLGSDFALALLDNKRVTGWGNDFSGKATYGNNLTGVIDISAGGNHSLALLANGKVTGWGDDTYSQAFRGNNLTNISGISAGWLHSLALDNTGKITGWGYDEYGQATSGNNITGAKEISAGKFHSLAILNSGNRVTGWGDDYFNQLSDIHKIIYSYQIKFTGISQTTNNGYDIFLLNSTGTITGLGTFSYYQQLQGITLTGITQISNSNNHVMMVNALNKITGFGNNDYYQISSGLNLTGVSQVGAGNSYTIALLKNKKVTGWGLNTDNQALGGNNLTGVKAISVGQYHNLAILNNNKVTGWGSDIYGQAQGGNYLTGVSGISAGLYHSLALFNDGTITGWGADGDNQARGGNNLTGVISISAGEIHSLALLKNGIITGWGYDKYANGGNNLTGVLKISAGFYNSTAILSDKNSVTGWGDINTLTDLFNITSIKSLGQTGLSGISAGLFSSYAYSGNNKKISNFGQQYLNINSLPKVNLTVTQLQESSKYNFAQGVNFASFIIENQNTGSINFSKNNTSLDLIIPSGYTKVLPIEPYSYDTLKSGKYAYSLTGSGFYNALVNYPVNDSLLPQYQTNYLPSAFFTSLSTMIITGYTASLPISIFFVEYGPFNSNQKTIQSYNSTGCYISTLNTGKLINLTGIGNPIKVNEPFYSDAQIGNLIMDTGRFEYYVNNRLIYSGSTGFNFGQILIGNNTQYTGTQPVSIYNDYPTGLEAYGLTGIDKSFNGNLFEVLIYDSGLSTLHKDEVFYYLNQKWTNLSYYYPQTTINLVNKVIYNEKTKINCTDCSPLLNSLPKENEPHVLLFEYNLYGYSGTAIEDCDMDMHVYILDTGFYEESRKEPLTSNLDIGYISGSQKSISNIGAKSQNIYNVADFNFSYNKIPPSQDRLKVLKSELKLQQPIRTYFTGEYLKYAKIDGNGV